VDVYLCDVESWDWWMLLFHMLWREGRVHIRKQPVHYPSIHPPVISKLKQQQRYLSTPNRTVPTKTIAVCTHIHTHTHTTYYHKPLQPFPTPCNSRLLFLSCRLNSCWSIRRRDSCMLTDSQFIIQYIFIIYDVNNPSTDWYADAYGNPLPGGKVLERINQHAVVLMIFMLHLPSL